MMKKDGIMRRKCQCGKWIDEYYDPAQQDWIYCVPDDCVCMQNRIEMEILFKNENNDE